MLLKTINISKRALYTTPISNSNPDLELQSRPDWPVYGLHQLRSNHDLKIGVGVGVDQNFLIFCGQSLKGGWRGEWAETIKYSQVIN